MERRIFLSYIDTNTENKKAKPNTFLFPVPVICGCVFPGVLFSLVSCVILCLNAGV
jgi:hypothetical protein